MRMQQSIAASVVLLLSAGSWAPSMIFAEDPPITMAEAVEQIVETLDLAGFGPEVVSSALESAALQ